MASRLSDSPLQSDMQVAVASKDPQGKHEEASTARIRGLWDFGLGCGRGFTDSGLKGSGLWAGARM